MLEKMIEDFNKEYEYLYDNYIEDAESVDEFDSKMKNDFAFKLLVSAFAEARHDFITSDREAAAFMRAFHKMQVAQ